MVDQCVFSARHYHRTPLNTIVDLHAKGWGRGAIWMMEVEMDEDNIGIDDSQVY